MTEIPKPPGDFEAAQQLRRGNCDHWQLGFGPVDSHVTIGCRIDSGRSCLPRSKLDCCSSGMNQQWCRGTGRSPGFDCRELKHQRSCCFESQICRHVRLRTQGRRVLILMIFDHSHFAANQNSEGLTIRRPGAIITCHCECGVIQRHRCGNQQTDCVKTRHCDAHEGSESSDPSNRQILRLFARRHDRRTLPQPRLRSSQRTWTGKIRVFAQ